MKLPNELVEKNKKQKSILIKCNKCLKEKMLTDFVTKTEIYKKKYYKKNICRECFPEFEKEHYKNKSLNYRIKKHLAWRLRHATNKIDSTMNYIGCNIQYVREWLEYNFTEEMNWDNYETFWSIDHVIPICNFDLTIENEKYKCWNWSNLIPVQTNNSFLAPPFQKVDNIVEKITKFKEEGSTTKWFSCEFTLNKELALMKAK
jgi:superfamily II helicase